MAAAVKPGATLNSLCPEGVGIGHTNLHSILCALTEAMHITTALLKTSKISKLITKNYTRKIYSGIRKA